MPDETNLTEERINNEGPIGCSGIKPEWCVSCANANGQPPWADSPLKAYCVAYPREGGMMKPPAVYYEGAECEFYRRER